jgi:hypothetical protein
VPLAGKWEGLALEFVIVGSAAYLTYVFVRVGLDRRDAAEASPDGDEPGKAR